MKKGQYFNIEVNFLSDENVAAMMMRLDPGQSVGIYLMLLLHLRKRDDYVASCSPEALKVIAWQNRLDVDVVEQVIRDFGLFEVDEQQQMFRSPYLDRVMQNLEERWRVNAENGRKGGRPAKRKKTSETPMDKGRKPNETQEKRGEEKRREVLLLL